MPRADRVVIFRLRLVILRIRYDAEIRLHVTQLRYDLHQLHEEERLVVREHFDRHQIGRVYGSLVLERKRFVSAERDEFVQSVYHLFRVQAEYDLAALVHLCTLFAGRVDHRHAAVVPDEGAILVVTGPFAVAVQIHRRHLTERKELVERPCAGFYHIVRAFDVVVVREHLIEEDRAGRVVVRCGNVARRVVETVQNGQIRVCLLIPPRGCEIDLRDRFQIQQRAAQRHFAGRITG